ncbi:hypothetical protein CERSUDRAFT_101126 [Gelatoporia subvermispora B]|uniref:Uncharacterized protein n=1 Tax=Ceriporiopsis subvermispora (strain B) TaxID=914234 RepID=M2QVW4_CERS8|nr:hypothetical protein CERSUDRAFT_101126 [Gelatoporia subvermispora B]
MPLLVTTSEPISSSRDLGSLVPDAEHLSVVNIADQLFNASRATACAVSRGGGCSPRIPPTVTTDKPIRLPPRSFATARRRRHPEVPKAL